MNQNLSPPDITKVRSFGRRVVMHYFEVMEETAPADLSACALCQTYVAPDAIRVGLNVPFAAGGHLAIDNIIVLCETCHTTTSASTEGFHTLRLDLP